MPEGNIQNQPLYPPNYNPRETPRFAEVPTFMRLPLTRDPRQIDIALVGVPYDGATTVRPGTREGPRGIRNMSSLVRAYHPVTRINPFEICRVGDVGDVVLNSMFDIEKSHQDITEFFKKLRNAGVRTIAAGGDHSISYPILRALAGQGPLGLLHIDAHTDTWDVYQGSRSHHGAPFRRAVEDGLIDPKRTVQIGIRGAQNTMEGWDYSRDSGMRIIFMDEVDEMGIEAVIAEARRVVGDNLIYLSFDVDALDPAYTPGTGTPEIGGLSTREALKLLRGFRGLKIVGADVVETSPVYDVGNVTSLVAATLMYEILCLMAETRRETD